MSDFNGYYISIQEYSDMLARTLEFARGLSSVRKYISDWNI